MKSLMDRVIMPATETINFEAFNAITPNTGVVKKEGQILPGFSNIWYEYLPTDYDPSQKYPLVIQIHGGGQDGMRWADITEWHAVAEREKFIVIYPNSLHPGRWDCDDQDVNYLCKLIEHMEKNYSIDPQRIYMQGMSNGDMMTLSFTMKHPELIAAAGYTSGPCAKEGIDGEKPVGDLPIMQERGELDLNWMLTPETEDVYHNRYTLNDENRELWEAVNGTEDVLPALAICGKDNFLIYQGTRAPIINWEIKDMGHREPVYSAEIYWDYLYSHCRLVDGKHQYLADANPLKAQEDLYVFALGSNKVYHKNQLLPLAPEPQAITRVMLPAKVPHFAPLKLNEMCQSEVICAPVDFLETCFGARITHKDAGKLVEIRLKDDRNVILRHGSLLVEVDGKFMAMQKPCLLLYGFLYVPIAEFCCMVLGLQVSVAHDVVCVSDHYALLGKYTARILCRLMGGRMRPHEKVEWEEWR